MLLAVTQVLENETDRAGRGDHIPNLKSFCNLLSVLGDLFAQLPVVEVRENLQRNICSYSFDTHPATPTKGSAL